MDYKAMERAIYTRKSHRSYERGAMDDATRGEILSVARAVKPLYPEIRTHIEIVDRKNIHTLMLWAPGQVIALYSEEADGYLANAGFILGQIDLYIQSRGLGACYIGLGKVDKTAAERAPEGMRFVMMLAIGVTKDTMRTDISEFRRRDLSEITDTKDPRLEPARLAPSAMNTQSWYFIHEGEYIHTYRTRMSRSEDVARMNTIDVGIALSHIYVSYPDTFTYYTIDDAPVLDNRVYIGSLTI